LDNALQMLPTFQDTVDCNAVFERDPEAMLQAATWTYTYFNISEEPFWNKIHADYNKYYLQICTKEKFLFFI
jgi:hypothetical protein